MLAIAPGNTADLFAAFRDNIAGITETHMIQLMIDINRELAIRQQGLFRRMFAAMLAERGPVLLHCAAGKDRTGFAAALVLFALGVPEAAVMYDYLLTGRYLVATDEVDRVQAKYGLAVEPAVLLPLLEARPEYLQTALATVQDEFGGIETYLREALGVDEHARKELRGRLLVE
jgi:protein-tyrosine phosphatase